MRHAFSLIVCLLAMSACQRAAPPVAPAATPVASAPAANASVEKPSGFFSMFSGKPEEAPVDLGDFKIVSVTLGNSVDSEQQVPAGKTVFGRTDRIYASVLSTGQHQGLKLSAKWTTADGQTVAETEQALVPTSATVTTFSLHNAEPWPAGQYQLVVSVDKQPQPALAFEIR